MKTTSIHREILALSIPSIIANITTPLLGIIDVAIVGNMGSAVYIAAIAIGSTIFSMLYWPFAFLRMGSSGMTAQAYGANNNHQCTLVLYRSILVALSVGIIIILLQHLIAQCAIHFMSIKGDTLHHAITYFSICIWGAPAMLGSYALSGWFIGMQDTVSPMAVDILVNIVNMLVSYLLAVYTPMGALGVAAGTVVAQYSGLLLALIILLWKFRHVWTGLSLWKLLKDRSGARNLISLNANLFIRSLCFMVVYVGFTSIAGYYGDTELAVSSILMKLFMLFSFFVDGFAYAGEALVGKIIGESGKWKSGEAESLRGREEVESGKWKVESEKLGQCVRLLFRWSMGVGLFFTLIYALWGRDCIALLTDDAEVLTASVRYIGWLIAMPIISTLAFMWDGIYVGATAGKEIRNAMIYAAVAFIVCYAALCIPWGIQALYVAYFAHLLARVVYLSIGWKRVLRV